MKFNPQFPYCRLLYWAKNWISYSITHPEWSITEQAEDIIAKTDSLASTYEPEIRLLFMFEKIVDWLKEYNQEHTFQSVGISRTMDSLWSWEQTVSANQNIYNCSRQEAIIRTIKNELFMISTGNMAYGITYERIIYDKSANYTTGDWKPGTTYKTQQKRFDRTWDKHSRYICK